MQNKIDMGLALLEMESWHKVSLETDFRMASDKKDLEQALNSPIQDNFLEIFDADSQRALRDMAAGITTDHVGNSILFSPDGTPLQILLVQREKKLEVFFQNIESRLRSLEHLTIFFRHFLTTPTPVCFTDKEAHIIDANRSFLDLYGYRLEEVRGQKPSILKSGRQSPAVYRQMWASITEGSSGNWSGEVINRRKDGEERTVHLTIGAVRRSNGSILGFVASSIDISREKKLEEALKARNEQLVELSNFKTDLVAMTSHDLKTPLDSIISRASLIKETISVISHDKILEHVERIISDCSRMAHFMRNTVDLDQMESGNFQLDTTRLHLDSVLRCSIDMNSASAIKKGIRVSLDKQATPQPVVIDALKMEQVFNNLIAHAVHFSPRGSGVSVVYRDCPEGKLVEVHGRRPGITDKDLEAMFDRSFPIREKGSVPKRGFGVDLGLNITRKIVELHGGKITAEKLPGDGCIFSVLIPTARPVVSGRDMAVLIHDPSGRIFECLQKPLAVNEVCCFITKNELEAHRILQYEKPNLVFLEEGTFTPELRNLLLAATGENKAGTGFILVAQQEPARQDPFFNRILVTPILDSDVFDVLSDIRLNHLPSAPPAGAYSILIVDDDETTHEILGEYLRLAGYKVRHAHDPTNGLELLATALPDLILLDVRMPEMDGLRMLEIMKKSFVLRNVPVVFLTDLNGSDIDEKGLELGAEDFIGKPFNKVELLARIRATLRRSAKYRKISGALEGNLVDVSLPELLQTLEIGRKSARINLAEMDGEILVLEGMFISARQGVFSGEEAFHRLFYMNNGNFTVHFGVGEPKRSGTAITLQSLLMRTATYIDEVRFALRVFPSEQSLLMWTEKGSALPLGLADVSPLLPCPLQDLLVLMKGALKENAEQLVTAHRENLVAPFSKDERAFSASS